MKSLLLSVELMLRGRGDGWYGVWWLAARMKVRVCASYRDAYGPHTACFGVVGNFVAFQAHSHFQRPLVLASETSEYSHSTTVHPSTVHHRFPSPVEAHHLLHKIAVALAPHVETHTRHMFA